MLRPICSPLFSLLFFWYLISLNTETIACFKNIFSSLNASPPCPSCSEPNVLDDSQGLAAEGSLSRYRVYPTVCQCLCWEQSAPYLHCLSSILILFSSISVSCSSLMVRPARQRCSNLSKLWALAPSTFIGKIEFKKQCGAKLPNHLDYLLEQFSSSLIPIVFLTVGIYETFITHC